MKYTRIASAIGLLAAFLILTAFNVRVQELETSLAQQEEALQGKRIQVYHLEKQVTAKEVALTTKDQLLTRQESGNKFYTKALTDQKERTAKRKAELGDARKEVARLETVLAQTQNAPKQQPVVQTASKTQNPKPKPAKASGIAMEATAYTAFCTGCIGVTATGVDVSKTIYYEGKRIVAVDPDVIPLHSLVRVQLKNGTSFNAIALDTGGAIQGNRVDVLVGSHAEAIAFGRQAIRVTILQ